MKRRFLIIIGVLLLVSIPTTMLVRKELKKRARAAETKSNPDPRDTFELAQARAAHDRRAMNDFANALRDIFTWRYQQPLPKEADRIAAIRTLSQKLPLIPVADLPKPCATTWQAMLAAWGKLAKAPAPDAQLMLEGQAAADAMNAILTAEGYGDLRF